MTKLFKKIKNIINPPEDCGFPDFSKTTNEEIMERVKKLKKRGFSKITKLKKHR